jgi:hypothetical protein
MTTDCSVALLEDNHRIPLFDGEKQQKTPVQAIRRTNPTFQVVDLIWVRAKFRYAAKQRNFSAEQRN